MAISATRSMYGRANGNRWADVPPDLLGDVEQTHSGNVRIRVGRVNDDAEATWSQVGYVVLSPTEARSFAEEILSELDR